MRMQRHERRQVPSQWHAAEAVPFASGTLPSDVRSLPAFGAFGMTSPSLDSLLPAARKTVTLPAILPRVNPTTTSSPVSPLSAQAPAQAAASSPSVVPPEPEPASAAAMY